MTASTPDRLLELAAPLGLSADTLEVLYLLPLVYVAWSDGEIQAEELQVVIESAEKLGLSSEASLDLLEGWLAERPSDGFFHDGLRLLSYLLLTLDEGAVEGALATVHDLCTAVAHAAGGLPGHAVKIGHDEQLALHEVTVRLGLASRQATRDALESILGAVRS